MVTAAHGDSQSQGIKSPISCQHVLSLDRLSMPLVAAGIVWLYDPNIRAVNGRKIVILAEDLNFNIITPITPTHYPNDVNRRPDILDIALMKGVPLELS
ncbi:hypothetical protein EVAR_69663_1 [Eumeta japonica]|uniref:Uncharacterized protein n=1 Tax=Eumeta variegata TaxID=151549 RepID=A0A4C1ZS18_EUMVA|nr:hypothetical protein EVAR_69663_1 [Eumeta japonica]